MALIFAAVLFAAPAYFGAREVRFAMDGRETTGVITGRYQTDGGRAGPNDHLQYEFSAAGRRYLGDQWVSAYMYESVPDAAPILVQYLSADPTVNRIDRDIERRFILIYGGLGVLVVASIGAPLWLLIRRRRIASTVLADGTPAFAQVISLERHVYRDTDEWVIGFRYFDHAGETHASTAKVDAAEPLKWKPGDRARVAFDNAHPERSVWIG